MGSKNPKELLGGLPETCDELLAHAGSLDEQGRTDDAIHLLEKACLRSPSKPLRQSLAAFYKKDGHVEDCIGILHDVLSRHPDDISATQLLADAQLAAGDIEGASKSKARLRELGVSRTGLLRLSLKLKKARAKADSEANEPAPAASDEESGLAGPPPLPHSERPTSDEEQAADSPGEADGEADDGDEEVDPSAFYVGPTRMASLSRPDEPLNDAPALNAPPGDLRQSISDFFQTHRVEAGEHEEQADADSGALSGDRREKLRKRSSRGTLMGLPTAPSGGGDSEDGGPTEESDDSFFADFERAEREEADEKPEYMQTLAFAGGALADSAEESEVSEVSEVSEAHEQAEPEATDEDEASRPEAESEPQLDDEHDAPSFFSEFEGAEAVSEGEVGPDLEPMADDADDDDLATLVASVQESEGADSELEDLDDFESSTITEYDPLAASASDPFDELDYEPTREFEGDEASAEDRRAYVPTLEFDPDEDSSKVDAEPGPPAKPARDQHGGTVEATAAEQSGDQQVEARQLGEEEEDEDDEWFAESGEDYTERSVADTSDSDIWRDRIEEGQSSELTMSMDQSGLSIWMVLLIILALLVTAAAGAGAYAMKSLGDAHEEGLVEAQRQQSPDTYQGYLEAVETLEGVSEVTSFAGPEVDAYMADFGLTSNRVASSREAAATQLALLNAMIEFRYEEMESRDSDDYIERARQVAGDGPELATARAYRLMAGGERQKAREALSKARLDYSRSRDLAAASIELELASGRASAANHAAELLRDTTRESVHFDYLLGRIDLAKKDPAAEDVLGGILEGSSPDHLDARIYQSYAVRLGASDEGRLDEARKLVEPILNGLGDRASPLQKAKAHVALGHTYMAEGASDEAGPHFEKAVELSPTRAGLHIDLVEYYVATEQAEEALEQIEVAVEAVGQTDWLSHLKAQALYQLRRCEGVIAAAEEISEPSHESEFLAGRCYLEIGASADAARAFESAAKLHEDTPIRAKAFEIVARSRAAPELDEGWLPVMNSLVEQSGQAPEMLRAKGLLLLEFAEAETGLREQRDFFDDAVATLEDAAEKRGDWRLVMYDLCRAHMRRGDEEKAVAHCEKGRELDPLYRPGVTTAIELAILRGEYDAASEMAAALGERFPDAPDVRLARVRTLVARNELALAEQQNQRWSTDSEMQRTAASLARGLAAFERGDYEVAASQFEVAHTAHPRRAEPAVLYAWAAARNGDDAGESILRDRLSDPLWGARAWQALGELRLRQERFNSARENFGEALSKYRDTIAPIWRMSEAYAGLATAWANLQGWDHYLTRRYVSRASSKADPNSVAAQFLSGVYHMRKRRSDFDKAAERFEYVIEREPYNCEALGSLLVIYKKKRESKPLERVQGLSEKHCNDT